MTKVSVVVPHLMGTEGIWKCLKSLEAQTFKDFGVIIIDNGSTDGSTAALEEEFPDTEVLRLGTNQGFAGGVNRGIEASSAEFVALLNDDAVAAPDWLERLVACLEADDHAGACASCMLNADGQVLDSAGNSYSMFGIPYPRGKGLSPETYDRGEVFAFSGGACLIRRSALDVVGLFDEAFFVYHEDVDLSFRLRSAGYSVLYEPDALVTHEEGASSGGGYSRFTRYHSVKNTWLVFFKNMPAALLWKSLPYFLFAQLMSLANSVKRGLLIPHLRGVGKALASLPEIFSNRRQLPTTHVEIERWMEKSLPPQHIERLGLASRRN